MTTLWDTTGTDVVKALAAERRTAGALAFGLVLTLIVVTDEKRVAEAEAAATTAACAASVRKRSVASVFTVTRHRIAASSHCAWSCAACCAV